jgi:hypothetical protein
MTKISKSANKISKSANLILASHDLSDAIITALRYDAHFRALLEKEDCFDQVEAMQSAMAGLILGETPTPRPAKPLSKADRFFATYTGEPFSALAEIVIRKAMRRKGVRYTTVARRFGVHTPLVDLIVNALHQQINNGCPLDGPHFSLWSGKTRYKFYVDENAETAFQASRRRNRYRLRVEESMRRSGIADDPAPPMTGDAQDEGAHSNGDGHKPARAQAASVYAPKTVHMPTASHMDDAIQKAKDMGWITTRQFSQLAGWTATGGPARISDAVKRRGLLLSTKVDQGLTYVMIADPTPADHDEAPAHPA